MQVGSPRHRLFCRRYKVRCILTVQLVPHLWTVEHRQVEDASSSVGFGRIGRRRVCVTDVRGLIRRIKFECRVQLLYLRFCGHLSAAKQTSERVHAATCRHRIHQLGFLGPKSHSVQLLQQQGLR